ncbi:MAG: hypothetical protein JWR19_2151 [Pedosphaera sp.]|nr:hypothetical protein [Pedosphaera sp.]
MIPITFIGNPAYLLDDAPDWIGGVRLDAAIPLYNEAGQTAIETRRPLGDSLRLALQYTVTLQGSSVPYFRNALKGLTTERVLCPLWPAWFDIGATPLVTALYYVCMGDGSAPAIHPAADLPLARPAYPLMVGRLSGLPDPAQINDDSQIVTINFTENDAFPLVPATFAATNALTAANGTRPIFPWRPDWSTAPHSGASEVNLERRNIGNTRSTADEYFAQPHRRTMAQSFTLSNGDPWNLIRFFLDMLGAQENFWLPASLSEARLTADVLNTDTTLTVDTGDALSVNSFIVLDDLSNRVPVKVTGIAGAVWTLPGAIGTAFTAAQTRLESLVLARFDSPAITIVWENADLATAQVKFREVPWEVAAVGGETIGTTMGPLPACAYLYRFTVNYPGATQFWYFTDFERNLTNGGHTYATGPFENDDIIETAILDRQSVAIRSRNFAGNPMSLSIPFQLEWPLLVNIYEADVSGNTAINLRSLFAGEIGPCESEGPFITGTARSLSAIFDKQIPRRLLQTGCNWVLFEPACGLLLADWKWQGTVAAYNPATLALSLTGVARVSGAGVTLTAHYFGAGFLYFGGGSAAQYRMISDSTAAVAGALTLSLSTAFATAPGVGDVVSFHPGCDGQGVTCTNKFNNYANFGSFPFMPIGNPSAIKVNQNAGQGGKK